MTVKKEYNAESIEVLEGLEAVRKRPGMYIGSTSVRGLHHLVWEVVDNSVDEALIGECDNIVITLHDDGSIEVVDNGRGMPVGLHKKMNIPAERVIFTILHAGGKFNNDYYKFSGGLHGVGASVVNALSEWLTVTIKKDNKIYKDEYNKGGKPVVKLNKDKTLPSIGKTKERGTSVRFKPDATIFDTIEFNPETIKKRLKELAYLNPLVTFKFFNEYDNTKVEYLEKEGLVGLISEINMESTPIHRNIINIEGESLGITVKMAMQFTKEYGESIISFTNNINNVEGGTHVTGFKGAFTRMINNYAKELNYLKGKDENFTGNDVRNGIRLVISIYHPDPQFEGQTKTKLGNTDAKQAVDEVVSFELQQYFDRNVDILEVIIKSAKKALEYRKVDETKRKSLMNDNEIKFETNKKLASCELRDNKKTEIYIVEGDSAGGSAKQGRNRKFQAILPLKGKIINVEKINLFKVLNNEEVQTLLMALGCGYGDTFDINKLKYNKVIIMTDADVDGAHIMTLLLTFFYRLMPELIFNGFIYIAMPPLYKVKWKNKVYYYYNDKELEKFKKGKTGYTIQRYKGLGEMNPRQLWDTTMNPETRYLKQVQAEDLVEMEEITSLCMSSKVPPRKAFIEKEAIYAEVDL